MKKIAIIGKGTAGAFTLNHFVAYGPWEVDLYYDNSIQPQAVGEGATLSLGRELANTLNFDFIDLPIIGGHYKNSIYYKNWGLMNFHHTFPPPAMSIHFNATRLQEVIFGYCSDKANYIEKNVKSYDEVDADYIIDCRGKPQDLSEYHEAEYIPVNAAIVQQCPWDRPEFDYSLCIARPYGWVFGIPLAERCSIGYLYNDKINNEEEVLEDVEEVLAEYNLTPQGEVSGYKFDNYYSKQNFNERYCLNGNKSFFLEPMEATSIRTIEMIARYAFDVADGMSLSAPNEWYDSWFKKTQDIIVMHYFAGSHWDTPFWEMAKEKATKCFQNATPEFKYWIANLGSGDITEEYSTFAMHSMVQNINGLGVYEELSSILGNKSLEF